MHKILLVDDNAVNNKLLSNLLRKAYERLQEESGVILEMEIDIALNGREACEKVEKMMKNGEQFSCIWMDKEMPIMGGVEAIGNIRDMEKEYKMSRTIIASLSTVSLEVQQDMRNAGADISFTKPIKVDDIKNFLSMYILDSTEKKSEVPTRKKDDPSSLVERWGEKNQAPWKNVSIGSDEMEVNDTSSALQHTGGYTGGISS